MILLAIVATVFHAVLVFAAAPLLDGIITVCVAAFRGLSPPPVLEPYRVLRHLLRQPPVRPDIATPLFPSWPYLSLAAAGGMALLVPSFATGMLTTPESGIAVFAGLALLGRTATGLAALEAGTAAGGAAAAGITLAASAMPVAIIALLAGSVVLGAPVQAVPAPAGWALAGLAAFTIACTEDAATGMDQYAGPDLALLNYAAWLRRLAWLSLIAALFLPPVPAALAAPLFWLPGLLIWMVKILLLALALAAAGAWLGALRQSARIAAASGLGILALVLLAGWPLL